MELKDERKSEEKIKRERERDYEEREEKGCVNMALDGNSYDEEERK